MSSTEESLLSNIESLKKELVGLEKEIQNSSSVWSRLIEGWCVRLNNMLRWPSVAEQEAEEEQEKILKQKLEKLNLDIEQYEKELS